MLYREIIAVCSQIQTKHITTLCRQNVEMLNVKLAVRTVVTAVVQQDHLVDQIGRRSVQHAATKSAVLRLWSSGI
jgi:hypothetical protein